MLLKRETAETFINNNLGKYADIKINLLCKSRYEIHSQNGTVATEEKAMSKTSIRFIEDIPVRAVWDEETSKWYFCAMDICEALTKSANARVYWATVKRRNPQLLAICKQLKLKGSSRINGE